MIKAIETVYNGYKFRSRLEARWAVFFDTLGVEYQYEYEGFDLDGDRYLPDFWISDWNCWVEIKPKTFSDFRGNLPPGKRECRLCQKLAKHTYQCVLLVGDFPWVGDIDEEGKYQPEYEMALFSPDFIKDYLDDSDGSLDGCEFGLGFTDPKSMIRSTEFNFVSSSGLYGFIARMYKKHPNFFNDPVPVRGDAEGLIKADSIYYFKTYKRLHPDWHYGIAQGGYTFYLSEDIRPSWNTNWKDYLGLTLWGTHIMPHQRLIEAYTAARQARFGT